MLRAFTDSALWVAPVLDGDEKIRLAQELTAGTSGTTQGSGASSDSAARAGIAE